MGSEPAGPDDRPGGRATAHDGDAGVGSGGVLAPGGAGVEPGGALASEPVPEVAARILGDHLTAAERYAALLVGDGVIRGLIGPREGQRIWTRHILNCAVVESAIGVGARVVDVGSGAGLPGIPLALARPDLDLVLLEPLERRVSFLQAAVSELGLANCRVVRGRAEDAVGEHGRSAVVTARAVAPLGRLAGWAAPLLRVGGLLLALKGSSAAAEVTRDAAAADRAGIGGLAVVEMGIGLLAEPTVVVRGERTDDIASGRDVARGRTGARRGRRGRAG